jgi:hypothetical protein
MTKVWSPKNKNKQTNTNTKKKSLQKKKQKTKKKNRERRDRDSQSTLTCDDPRPTFSSEADNVGSLTIDYTGPETPRPRTQVCGMKRKGQLRGSKDGKERKKEGVERRLRSREDEEERASSEREEEREREREREGGKGRYRPGTDQTRPGY